MSGNEQLHKCLFIWLKIKSGIHYLGDIVSIKEYHDGWRLVKLIEVLSAPHNRKFSPVGIKPPKNSKDTLRNFERCLHFMEKDLNIWLRGCKASDLATKTSVNSDNVLYDIIFQLLLYYDVEMVLTRAKPYHLQRYPSDKLLLEWINEALPEGRIVSNFTTDWKDGVTFAALLFTLSSGELCPDWSSYSINNNTKTWTDCIALAEKRLLIPEMFSAVHVSCGSLNAECMIVYLSQFVLPNFDRSKTNNLQQKGKTYKRVSPVPDYEDADDQLNPHALPLEERPKHPPEKDNDKAIWELIPLEQHEKLRQSFKDGKLLDVGTIIGQGHRGLVYNGRLRNADKPGATNVAVKILRDEVSGDKEAFMQFIDEAITMRNFDHPNVLGIIGFTIKDNVPYILLPFMGKMDLSTHLEKNKHETTTRQLIDYGLQIAKGMKYLSKLHFVHRDLAARNCMLDDEGVVKIGDFGQTRDVLRGAYAKQSGCDIPMAWTAPESLETKKYTTESDVWSYGMLLWELFSYGKEPYADCKSIREVERHILSGHHLPIPQNTPKELYDVMKACWSMDAAKRITFPNIVICIEKSIDQTNYDTIDYSGMETMSTQYGRIVTQWQHPQPRETTNRASQRDMQGPGCHGYDSRFGTHTEAQRSFHDMQAGIPEMDSREYGLPRPSISGHPAPPPLPRR